MKNLSKAIEKTMSQIIDLALNKDFKWKKFWTNLANANTPMNYVTQKPYNGLNEFYLSMVMTVRNVSNQFLTFNQIKQVEGSLNQGSKGYHLVKWVITYTDTLTGKKYTPNDVNNLPSDIRARLYKSMFPNNFVVFSIADTDLTPKQIEKIKVNEPIKTAQKIVDTYSKNVCPIKFGVNNSRAFYSMSDYINMPEIDAFNNSNSFYHVCFHEMAHSTGHEKRLNRDMSGWFGNDKYAKEELIAELSSNLLSAKLGILNDELIKNSAAYLTSWIKKFSEKKTELYEALNAAKKVNDYILKVVE